MKRIILFVLLLCSSLLTLGQSSTYINGSFDINAGVPVTWYGDVEFGPDAVVYLEDGAQAIFYGKRMVVSPGARFICLPGNGQTGTGSIIFRGNNPLYGGYPLGQTLDGGYGSGIDPTLPNIEIDNADGLSLTGSARISNMVRFTQGHLYLNNFNLVLDDNATFNGYEVGRHVVTNGTGVVVKEGLPNGGSFIFPVSIAGLDYTPATVANRSASRDISVQVKEYGSSPSNEVALGTRGMDRTWQISGSTSGAADVTLQHNAATNANGTGTNGAGFNNSLSYVSQQLSAGVWSSSCGGSDGGSLISIHTGAGLMLPGIVDATAYFTKQTVNCTDLMVSKTINNVGPVVGSNVTFTITARNNGTADATGVSVNDLLPSGYTFASSTASVGAYNMATGVWTIGNLSNGASATLTVTATILSTGSYANTATIAGAQTDPDPSNNTSTVTPVPGALQANLGVSKTAGSMSPVIGDNVTFTITANNAGPDAATGVSVSEQLPAGYTYISATASAGSFNSGTGVWTIGAMANGASATLTVTARVNAAGPYANTAIITGSEPDPVPGNNSATVTPVPNAALVDLSIAKTAPMVGIHIGQEFDYTIQVKNIGSNLATGVVMSDVLPEQLSYVSHNSAYGSASYGGGNRTLGWNIGSLAAGASAELTIRVKANRAGTVANTATVGSTEVDSDPSNNSSTHTRQVLGLQIPNVITPDGDGKNDTFRIPGIEAYPENTLIIHNRWGNEVWKSTGMSYRNDWDGRGLNGGTYYYVLKLRDGSGSWQTFAGWVTLLRD